MITEHPAYERLHEVERERDELLAALKEIADDHCECEGPNEATHFEGRVCRFHAAIAKAEG